VTSVIVAVILGLAMFGLLLVFPPIYFPWALLVIVSCGLVVGLTVDPARSHGPVWAAAFSALLLVTALLVLGRVATAGAYFSLFLSDSWLFVPATAGAFIGAAARRRLGFVRASAGLASAVAVIGVTGAVLALMAAPREVANAPRCDQEMDCARMRCWLTAERRRLYALERVTEFGGGHITCTYVAWGGADIGRVRDGGWTDGEWPILLGAPRR